MGKGLRCIKTKIVLCGDIDCIKYCRDYLVEYFDYSYDERGAYQIIVKEVFDTIGLGKDFITVYLGDDINSGFEVIFDIYIDTYNRSYKDIVEQLHIEIGYFGKGDYC